MSATSLHQVTDSVLVVDDSEDTARVTSRMLMRRGFRVRVASDGLQALDLVNEEAPDCILLDVMMPRMSGFEVLERLKGNPQDRRDPRDPAHRQGER